MWVWIAFSVFVVLGAVHQSKGIKVKNSEGKIEAPQVAAGVIYADEIKANTVMAETCAISIVADSPPSRPSPRSALSRPAAGRGSALAMVPTAPLSGESRRPG
jgi:hypothetical protein